PLVDRQLFRVAQHRFSRHLKNLRSLRLPSTGSMVPGLYRADPSRERRTCCSHLAPHCKEGVPATRRQRSCEQAADIMHPCPCENGDMKCVGSMNIMPHRNVLAIKKPSGRRFNISTAPSSQRMGAKDAANVRIISNEMGKGATSTISGNP